MTTPVPGEIFVCPGCGGRGGMTAYGEIEESDCTGCRGKGWIVGPRAVDAGALLARVRAWADNWLQRLTPEQCGWDETHEIPPEGHHALWEILDGATP